MAWLSCSWCFIAFSSLPHTVSWVRCGTFHIDSWSLPSSLLDLNYIPVIACRRNFLWHSLDIYMYSITGIDSVFRSTCFWLKDIKSYELVSYSTSYSICPCRNGGIPLNFIQILLFVIFPASYKMTLKMTTKFRARRGSDKVVNLF